MIPHPRPAAPAHPRRTPAERSVSLKHSPSHRFAVDRSDSSSDTNARRALLKREQGQDSPSSLQPLGRGSSGESSNAERWFEQSNNKVQDASASFVDNEPPFFMRNSSSSETPPELQYQRQQYLQANDGTQSLPLRTGLLRLGTDGSSTEDLRSVIDDLTVQNKKLKRKLKRYETLHDAHLKDEKLFEVRIHGLPAEKKRELEETLRKFASGLNERASGAEFPPNGYDDILPALKERKTAESQASLHNTDSAYASMSASGQGGSSGRSGSGSRHNNINPSAVSRQQTIHSYLHHIPEGLLPQSNPSNMTERAKKKMVVKRLEQIFAGKGAAGVGHQHQLQQQEVSQSAARDDRSAMEAQGRRAGQEGIREAFIMEQESDDSKLEFPSEHADRSTVEQRPTRPLDLDPHRAQVPEDNVAYFRHLGFSPPNPGTPREPEEGHGWIYLNLLINMAQLHTINVTPDFVMKALGEYSDKLELSSDGRKARWRGGRHMTRTSSDSGGASSDRTRDDVADGLTPRKRRKVSHRHSIQPQGQGGVSQRSRAGTSKHVYTPMFYHRDSTEDSEDTSSEEGDEAASSPFPPPAAGDSSGMATSSGFASRQVKRSKKSDDGPMIFYNNAPFCLDLSGERKPGSNPHAPSYTKLAARPLGKPRSAGGRPSEKRGPLAVAVELPEPMDLDDNPIPSSLEVSFPARSPLCSSSAPASKPVQLEVTGIGGVWPADNFAMEVETRHARVNQSAAPGPPASQLSRSLPPKLASVLPRHDAKRQVQTAVRREVIACHRQDLPPSTLPPALSFMPLDEETMSDEESDDGEQSMVWQGPNGAKTPSVSPQAINMMFGGEDDEGDEADESDESEAESDSSLDLLAAARQVDPEAIRAKEREYDANVAERLAEEIPAGSSAATAGGGSGFASPAKGVAREEYERAKREVRAATAAAYPNLKRAETDESMQVQGAHDSSSSEDSSENSSEEEREDVSIRS